MINRGIAICHYNRTSNLEQIISKVQETAPVNCKIFVCDDGSDVGVHNNSIIESVETICSKLKIPCIVGPNKGVAANKNRALWALQDCHFLTILEDDLVPIKKGWFEAYETAACLSGIHHFCRVQNKEVEESVYDFHKYMTQNNLTPIYGPSPRGDLTFLTKEVIRRVGAFNPKFIGAGYAHGEWTERVVKTGLIPHPLKYVDIREARDSFEQVGDTTGGRWGLPKEEINQQILRNKKVLKKLQRTGYTFHPLVLG